MTELCMKKSIENLESLIVVVLENFLKREPTLSDAKKCNKIYIQDEYMNFTLTYDGNIVGFFSHELEHNEKRIFSTWNFHP